MAVKAPVCRDRTSTAVLTPRAVPRANLPSQPLFSRRVEEWLPRLERQSVVVESLSVRRTGLIWLRGALVAGPLPSWGLPGVKICLNLTPALCTSARDTRPPVDHGRALKHETRADICSAMSEETDGSCYYSFPVSYVVTTLSLGFVFDINTPHKHSCAIFVWEVKMWTVPFKRGAG